MTTTETYNVSATRVFDAPLERVWEAWRDGAQVQRWWGPHGFTVPVAQMDFREGGRSLVGMQAPPEWGGQTLYNTWTYTRIVPRERLEFVLHFSDAAGTQLDPSSLGLPPGIPHGVPHHLTFRALDAARTEMTLTEFGYTTQAAHDTSLAGLEQVLDKLAASLA